MSKQLNSAQASKLPTRDANVTVTTRRATRIAPLLIAKILVDELSDIVAKKAGSELVPLGAKLPMLAIVGPITSLAAYLVAQHKQMSAC